MNNNNNNNRNNFSQVQKAQILAQLFKHRKWVLSFLVFSILSFIINRKAIFKRIYKLSFLPDSIKLFIERNLLSFEDYDYNDNSGGYLTRSSLTTPGGSNSPSTSPPLFHERNTPPSNNNNNNNGGVNDIIVPRISLDQLFKKKICISTIGTIFQKKINYDQITDKKVCEFKFIESEKDILVRLASEADLYLITQTENEDEEKQVDNLLKSFGIYDAGLNRNKSLFCSTSQGKGHISRHLEVLLHIDDDITVLQMLKPFVKYLVLIGLITTTTNTASATMTNSANTSKNNTNSSTAAADSDKQRITSTLSISNYFYYST